MTTKLKCPTYHQYSVLVNNKDAQHAEANRLTIQTAQKHDYLKHTQYTFRELEF